MDESISLVNWNSINSYLQIFCTLIRTVLVFISTYSFQIVNCYGREINLKLSHLCNISNFILYYYSLDFILRWDYVPSVHLGNIILINWKVVHLWSSIYLLNFLRFPFYFPNYKFYQTTLGLMYKNCQS